MMMNRIALMMIVFFGSAMLAISAGCQATGGGASIVTLTALSELPEDAQKVEPIGVGELAPTLPGATIRHVDGRWAEMGEIYRKGPTVLVFYRGGWCPFCTRQLAELGAIQDDLRELGVQIVGVSPDQPARLQESVDEHDLGYTLLSDSDAELMRAFGVAFRVDDETNKMLEGHGIDLADASGRQHRVLPVPAVYVIDTRATIRFAQWGAEYRERISADEVLRAAKDAVGR